MNRPSGWFSPSYLFGPNRVVKGKKPGRRHGWRRFRPVVTGLEDRRLLTNYALTTLANGANPSGGVVLDGQGNLYGTTATGGASKDGTVFEIAKGSNSIITLASFNGTNGASPFYSVVLDGQGNLYGTTQAGGASNDGTVFELAKGSNTITTLASFIGTDYGVDPNGVVLDGQGNLYGTTKTGWQAEGMVFELAKGSKTITTLAAFNYDNGEDPFAGVVLDGQGNLYGTSPDGGSGCGTVFEIANGSNSITTLAAFNYTNGCQPTGGVVLDGQGNLYGTTVTAGASKDGTVFEIAKGSNSITTLASFNGTNGASPFYSVVLDGQGNLYGTTQAGGASNDGTVFELAKGSNTITTLASFNYTNEGESSGGVVLDGQGNLYGTTSGGTSNGTVFELERSGATQLMVTSQPPKIVGLDDKFDVKVSAEDANGNVDTSFNGAVTMALDNNPGGATLGGTLTVNAVNGVADFPDLTLNKAGSGYTLQATSAGLTSVDTGSFSVAYIVTNTSDSGPGSLSDMITAVDADPIANGPDQITFASSISGATISLQNLLPALTRNQVSITGPITLEASTLSFALVGLDIFGNQDSVQDLAITFFSGAGIYITGSNDSITGSQIGGNQTGIVVAAGATGNTIGGTVPGAGNVIIGNQADGIDLNGAQGTTIQGNWIGTDLSDDTDVGNGADGVNVFGGATANTIGGTASAAGNTIAFNLGDGVTIGNSAADPSTGDAVLGNVIYGNAGLGIDLGHDGVTPNDSSGHSGPNLFQNFPVLSSAFLANGGGVIAGSLSGNADTSYRLEFFSNAGADPSGYGQGQTFLGFWDVTTDSNGNASFTANVPTAVTNGQFVCATATDSFGNTSEFSADIPVQYTPDQIRAAYGLPPIEDLPYSWSGAGQTIAIVVPFHNPNLEDDVQAFNTQFNLPQFGSDGLSLNVYTQTQTPTDPTVTNATEEAMDVEWAHAIAPSANIDVVEARSLTMATFDPVKGWVAGDEAQAVQEAADLPGVSVVSMSFGGGEFPGESTFDSLFTTPKGVTFVASSGDDGSPSYPAISPNVVAVGGTTLTVNADGSYSSETGWGGSGGGRSQRELQPAYQAGVVPASMSSGALGLLYRTSPDVSFDADYFTGVAVATSFQPEAGVGGGPWRIGYGTSLGAPCWAGLIAIVNQGCATPLNSNVPRQTLAALYSLASDPTSYARDFHLTGYNTVTGLGTPIASNLVPDLINSTVGLQSPTVTSIAAVSPNPRNTAVASIQVTFNEPIALPAFSASWITLTRNGGLIPVTSDVTATLVSGSTYQINGLSGVTASDGSYTLTVYATGVTDASGNTGTNSLLTSWLMDTTPPSSEVNPLPKRETSLTFPVSVASVDSGTSSVGITSYDIYSSANGGPWTLWTNVPASNPAANFTGQSNTTYSFYSIAHDLAGNPEVTQQAIEASTYVPDLTPPVTSVDGTSGTNPSTLNTSTGTFTLDLTGSDPGGGLLTYFEVFVSVDGGAHQEVGPYAIPAGAADSKGNYHSTIIYQGLTDGQSHTYSFYSIGLDAAGNLQSAPSSPNVTFSNEVFTTPGQLQVTGFTVEHDSPSRSFVRYLDLTFNESDSQSGGELTLIVNSISTMSPDILIYKYNLDGSGSGTPVPLNSSSSPTILDVLDHAIEIDFGSGGILGTPNTTAADGYYKVVIKLPGQHPATHYFDRILGDVNGDGIVDSNDLNEIAASINETSRMGWTPLSADVTVPAW